ncbi:MAG: hypothetical protein JRI25_13710 [Deltaproteobacteria bacterium]|nr:hypothetical protein [Deltaproteobacteria bacterium]
MTDYNAILERLDRLERELDHTRRRAKLWRNLVLVGVVGVLALPATVGAAKLKSSMMLTSPDGRQEAELTAQGLEFRYDGTVRMKLDIGEEWDRFTMYRQNSSPSFSFGTDENSASFRVFSGDEKLRLELTDNLLDSGSGLRLYDDYGYPRATLYSGQRDGETGLRITDSDRQPRIELRSQPDGVAMFRVSDSGAQSVAELSVLHMSDASYRQLGFVQELENDPMVPMVYMFDSTGTNKLIMPATPH